MPGGRQVRCARDVSVLLVGCRRNSAVSSAGGFSPKKKNWRTYLPASHREIDELIRWREAQQHAPVALYYVLPEQRRANNHHHDVAIVQ